MFRYFLLEQAGSMFYLLPFIMVFTILAYAESIDDLEQAIAQNPDDLDARKELALSYYEQGDLNRAVIQLESLVQLDPGAIDVARDLTAAYRMVSLKLQAQKEYSEALRYADKSITLARKYELDPVPGQYQRVIVLSEAENMNQALEELDQLPPESEFTKDAQDLMVAALLRQAKASVKLKDYQKALEQISRASQIDPQKYSYLHLQAAHILAFTGEVIKALEALNSIARSLPRDNDLFQYRIGSLYRELGEVFAATEFLARVPESSPYYQRAQAFLDKAERVMELLQSSREALAAGDVDGTIMILRDLISIDPMQYRIRLNLAKLLIKQEEHQDALAELEFLSMSPRIVVDPFYQLEMGKLYNILGQQERSKRFLKQIQRDSSHYPEAQKLLENMAPPAKPDEETGEMPGQEPDIVPDQPSPAVGPEGKKEPAEEKTDTPAKPEKQIEEKPLPDSRPPIVATEPEIEKTPAQDQKPVKPEGKKEPAEVKTETPVKPEKQTEEKPPPDSRPVVAVTEPEIEKTPAQDQKPVKTEGKKEPAEIKTETPVEPEKQIEEKPPPDSRPVVAVTEPEIEKTPAQDQEPVKPEDKKEPAKVKTETPVEPEKQTEEKPPPDSEPLTEPEIAETPTQKPPAPGLATAQTLAEQGHTDEAISELNRILADPAFQRDDRMEYEIGILYMQLGDESNAKEHLKNVSEDSLFYRAAQAFLTEPIVEEPAVEEQIAMYDEPLLPTRPIHPVEKRVRDIATSYQLDTSLALALMKQESNLNKLAVSRAGAAGLCQIMPATGRDLGLKIPNYSNPKEPKVDPNADERFDPYKCMNAGFSYLRQLLNRYDGNVPLALSAYNAGMGRTKERVARIYETTTYVSDIMTYYWRYQDEDVLLQVIVKLVDNIQ